MFDNNEHIEDQFKIFWLEIQKLGKSSYTSKSRRKHLEFVSGSCFTVSWIASVLHPVSGFLFIKLN